jgi:superfamily II DNA or RNA helicase
MDETINKKEVIQSEALRIASGHARCGLGISMGVGKTLIGLRHMQAHLELNSSATFLVVAPKKAIFQSWKDDAIKFGMDTLLEHITFSTYRSLEKQSRDHTVVYLDECHSLLYVHDFFLSTYGGYILGLSGTPPRYANSEKGEMVAKYCPIVYTYITDDAVSDDILNDYVLIIHTLPLSDKKTFKVALKKGGFFMNSEKEHYEYWTKKILEAFSPVQKKIFRIMRMQGLMQYGSKEIYTRDLLTMLDNKCLVFCNTTDQASRISDYGYHTANPDSEADLAKFKTGAIPVLSCVQQLSEGINIPDLKYGIILHSYSNERKSSQRIGRMLRLSPDQTAHIHILVYEDTVDQEWVHEALKGFNQEKIVYM